MWIGILSWVSECNNKLVCALRSGHQNYKDVPPLKMLKKIIKFEKYIYDCRVLFHHDYDLRLDIKNSADSLREQQCCQSNNNVNLNQSLFWCKVLCNRSQGVKSELCQVVRSCYALMSLWPSAFPFKCRTEQVADMKPQPFSFTPLIHSCPHPLVFVFFNLEATWGHTLFIEPNHLLL